MECRGRMEITAGFCILWALLILVLPLKFLLGAAFAALVHELCHALAVRLTGGQVLGLTLDAGGLTMEVSGLDARWELLCALAGPAGSILISQVPVPEIAVCALIQGLFNLIPLAPLDGGRALGCALELFCPRWRRTVQSVVEWAALLGLLAAIPVFHLGAGAYAAWMLVAMRKFPCKQGRKALQ